jgi:hypothetical protein
VHAVRVLLTTFSPDAVEAAGVLYMFKDWHPQIELEDVSLCGSLGHKFLHTTVESATLVAHTAPCDAELRPLDFTSIQHCNLLDCVHFQK